MTNTDKLIEDATTYLDNNDQELASFTPYQLELIRGLRDSLLSQQAESVPVVRVSDVQEIVSALSQTAFSERVLTLGKVATMLENDLIKEKSFLTNQPEGEWQLIKKLTQNEGEGVTIFAGNPDMASVNDYVIEHTLLTEHGFGTSRFGGDTVLECLQKAIKGES